MLTKLSMAAVYRGVQVILPEVHSCCSIQGMVCRTSLSEKGFEVSLT